MHHNATFWATTILAMMGLGSIARADLEVSMVVGDSQKTVRDGFEYPIAPAEVGTTMIATITVTGSPAEPIGGLEVDFEGLGAVSNIRTDYSIRTSIVTVFDLAFDIAGEGSLGVICTIKTTGETIEFGLAGLGLPDPRDERPDDEFEENDTPDQAAPLEIGQPSMLYGFDEDWFHFEIDTRKYITIEVVGGDGDLDLFLFAETGSQSPPLEESTERGTNELIESELAPGQYLILVKPYEGNGSVYTLSIHEESVDEESDDEFEENDTPEEAKELLPGSYSLDGNDPDWFMVSVDEDMVLTVEVEGTRGDLDLFIFDETLDSDNPVAISVNDNSSESISESVESGEYFVAIAPYQELTSPYSLTITLTDQTAGDGEAPLEDDDFEPNNTFDEATEIGVGERTLAGFDEDWFSITIEETSAIKVEVDAVEGDLDILLYAEEPVDGEWLADSQQEGSNEEIAIELPAGSYLLRIYPYQERVASTYDLSIVIEEIESDETIDDDEFEENDTPENAAKISPGTLSLQGLDVDWFVITVESDATLAVWLTGESGDLDLLLYNQDLDLDQPTAVSEEDGSSEEIEASVVAGKWYIAVVPYRLLTSEYTLMIEVIEADVDTVGGTGSGATEEGEGSDGKDGNTNSQDEAGTSENGESGGGAGVADDVAGRDPGSGSPRAGEETGRESGVDESEPESDDVPLAPTDSATVPNFCGAGAVGILPLMLLGLHASRPRRHCA